MADYVTLSKYGVALETTNGTLVTPSQGIPQESLITFNLGHEWANTPKMQGLPYSGNNEYVNIGRLPSAEGFSHNISPRLLHLLLSSMHGGPGDEVTNVWTIGTADVSTATAYPAAGADYTYGLTARPYTLSVKHETGATGNVNHAISGCVCTSLTLTFPSGGGPVKMAYSLTGMTSADNIAAGGTYTLETTGADLISSAFTYSLCLVGGSPTVFYPEGDVVITFAPKFEVLKRGEDRPRSILVNQWGGTFSFGWPWDASGDVDDVYEAYRDGEHVQLRVSSDDTPDAIGEYLFDVRGRIVTAPSLEGEGILRERGEFQMCGSIAATPYAITYFDSVMT